MSTTPRLDHGHLAEDVAVAFHRDGFAVVPNLAEENELGALRQAYDLLLAGEVGGGAVDRFLGGITRQIMMPHLAAPIFSEHPVIERAQKIAEGLVHTSTPPMMFSMLIYKPPGHPHETPWHQDMSYAGRPVTRAGSILPNDAVAQFWLALDDVTEDMGCMQFAPNYHNNPMPEHFVASGDPDDESRLLAMVDPEAAIDMSTIVACPLKAGSATVHGYATPHYTGPNRSDSRGRRAFIFSFANPRALEAISGDRADWPTAADQGA